MKTGLKRIGLGIGLLLAVIIAVLGAFKLIWIMDDRAPEAATGRRDVPLAQARKAMVVTANPLATAAGVDILQRGGSAIDAAVGIQAVLTVVEPQSSGIGGGAFILHFARKSKRLQAFDGRETAPAGSEPGLFMHGKDKPYNLVEASVGGRPVGVPGALRALELAHRQHGTLPWQTLFEAAIQLCENGFAITPRLNQLAYKDPLLRTMPAARDYFYSEDGRAKPVGSILKNPALAQVLRVVAAGGADAFYLGPVARDIAAAVKTAQRPSTLEASINLAMLGMGAPYGLTMKAEEPNPGSLVEQDLATYRAIEREPICRPYRTWKVCGFGPPTSGGITVLQILALLERFPLGTQLQPNTPESVHLLAEAERLAYADRDRYIADNDFVAVPVRGLLDSRYLASRSLLIDPAKAAQRAEPGRPPGLQAALADGRSPELPSTSHFSVVDADRNVVSMTTSLGFSFGARVMVRGFMLNNHLTDFSFSPGSPEQPIANALAPTKRPRSSMAPTIVFDGVSGEPVMALGSAGGSAIISHVVRALLGVLEWGFDPQQAVSLPHVVNRGSTTELENEGWRPGELDSLKQKLPLMGHELTITEQNSGLHAILILNGELQGGVDPRREGLAAGW